VHYDSLLYGIRHGKKVKQQPPSPERQGELPGMVWDSLSERSKR
jgi:hypothetical protein